MKLEDLVCVCVCVHVYCDIWHLGTSRAVIEVFLGMEPQTDPN